jgi:cytochrome d ubiquinol oxidase subunit I
MEALFETQAGAPLLIGGIPDPESGEVRWGIEIPYALSLLIEQDPNAVITGLNDFPNDQRPNVVWVHLAFQAMVGCGLLLILISVWYWCVRWWGTTAKARWMLRSLVFAAPLGFIALEAGWIVTEMGRQPWTIHGLMKTSDAVTPARDIASSLLVFTVLYLGLAATLVVLLVRLARSPSPGSDAAEPFAYEVGDAD